ncbi:MAG TPA: rhomboid family intramembrane serine protease [Isosphaeraceae bacterium]
MRQVGSVASEREANLFADYLLAQKIPTKILPTKDGRREIWVQNEDHVPRASEEFRAFVEAPDDPRYRDSREVAREVRRAREKAEKDHARNTRDLRDRWEGPSWRRYPLTVGLIVVSVAVSVMTNFGRDRLAGLDAESLNKPTLFRSLVFSDYTIRWEAKGFFPEPVREGHGFADILHGQVWRLVTPIFLHFSIWHLVFNMSALRYFGGLIETRKGTLKLAILVLVSAVASNVGECLIELQSRDVVLFGGMSGVAYALFGYLWMKGWAHPEEGLGVNDNTVVMMIVWFLLCFTKVLGPVANAAHGVGLAVGMAFGLTRF